MSPKYPAPPIATEIAKILQQVISQNQELMILHSTNSGKCGIKNIHIPPTPSVRPLQEQPCHPIPEHFDKCFFAHGRGYQKGNSCNFKAYGHTNKATKDKKWMEDIMDAHNGGVG